MLTLRASAVTLLTVLCAAACQRSGGEKLAAATRALEATGDYRVVASDAQRGLLTVRSTRSGALQVLDLNAVQTLAGPPSVAPAAVAPATNNMAAHVAATEPAAAPAASPTATPPVEQTGASAPKMPGYKIERVPGPAATVPAAASSPTTLLSGVSIDHAVICRSGERLRLQQVLVTSTSAGIVLQSGCQLELIDSEVRSGDIGLVVNAGATLLIENSIIRGRTGSIQAAGSTRVVSWASTFNGPSVLEGSNFADRGGNTWN